MYTIKQIKELKETVAVMLHNRAQWEKLRNLRFNLTSKWNGPALYSPNTGTWASNSTLISNNVCYNGRTMLDYSQIDFEEQYIPIIFN